MRNIPSIAMILVCLAAAGGVASAQIITLPLQIDISMTLTADHTYALAGQTFVNPGASLTVEAGVVVQSDPVVQGSLAVTRGAQIFILGSVKAPVIFTSQADVATWNADPGHPTGKDPGSGVWREAANEWGNITIMGEGFIAEDAVTGNVPTCNANNVGDMEGLVPNPMFPTRTQYGGGNDDDDSGVLHYLSLRYGGKVVNLTNELNGLSLGGIGRETDISYVEIMNNVDDGIEMWGGCVTLKFISIWNIGDDSFDIDQGWRGKCQFLLIVQGWSLNASQGSGVGDNCIEHDGAEDSDWQPVTTAVIENATVIGQRIDGDGMTAWRDGCRMQYHDCLFYEGGDHLVRFDNIDGDGAHGYGFGGSLTWPQVWTTPYDMVPAHPNDCPAGIYKSQSSGFLAQMTDCLMVDPGSTTEATARGVFAAANNNTLDATGANGCPLKAFVRAAPVMRGGKIMEQVTTLDPRLDTSNANGADAANPVAFCDGIDDFFSYAPYKGAFDTTTNWLAEWTASAAFGFTPRGTATDYCSPAITAGQAASSGGLMDIECALNSAGDDVFQLTPGPHKTVLCGGQMAIHMEGQSNQPIVLLASPTLQVNSLDLNPLIAGAGQFDIDLNAVAIVADGGAPGLFNSFFRTDSNGVFSLELSSAAVPPGLTFYFQAWISNTMTFIRLTNAVCVSFI